MSWSVAESELRTSGEDVVGTVRAAVFQSAMLALMPAALEAMRTVAPDVRVELVQREPETALRETWLRDFDLVVAEQYPSHAAPHPPGLDRQALTTDAIRLAVSAGEHGDITSVAHARGMPWVMEPRGAASRHYAEQLCRIAGFEPDVRFETADLQAHVRLVETGNAVAFLPDLIWWGAEPTGCRLVEPARKPPPHRLHVGPAVGQRLARDRGVPPRARAGGVGARVGLSTAISVAEPVRFGFGR